MVEILANLLSSVVLVAVITKLSNDHDRKKNYLIEEMQERRNELRRISRELEFVKKYNKDTKRILKDLKLCLNAYGKYSSNGNKEDLLRDAHIWREIEMLEKDCEGQKNKTEQENKTKQEKCFEKHKDKLLQYMDCLIEYATEGIKKEATTSYYNVAIIGVLLIPVVFAIYGLWNKNVKISGDDIVYSFTILVMVYILLQIPVLVEKKGIKFSYICCVISWVGGIVFYIAVCFNILSKYRKLLGDTTMDITFIISMLLILFVMAMYVWQTSTVYLYSNSVKKISNKGGDSCETNEEIFAKKRERI